MELPNRKQNRLKEYDYSTAGKYFVTICTKDRKCILSRVVARCAEIKLIFDKLFDKILLDNPTSEGKSL
jgi:hypothetical protein